MGLERLSELLRKGLMIAGGVSLLALTLLATLNVSLRIFRVPVSGTYEIVSFLGAIVTAGALGYTQKRKDHIVVDILSEKFPAKVKRALDRANYLLILVFFSIVFSTAWSIFHFLFASSNFSSSCAPLLLFAVLRVTRSLRASRISLA